jgi:hypothetical protein
MNARWILLTLMLVLLASASAAHAKTDCKAPPGTAAVEQYCESLPSADGDTHLGDKPARPLAAVLPEPIVQRLQKAGVAGEVILALPAGPTPEHRSGRRQTPFDPRVKALLPGPALSPKSVVDAAAKNAAEHIDQGFGWALVLTLFGLGGLSVAGSLRLR